MKAKCITIARSFVALALISLLFSLVFACLYYFHWIGFQTFQIMCWIAGLLGYGIGGFILGKGIPKKALLHALGCMIFMGVLTFFMMASHSMVQMALWSMKLFLYLVCAVLAANLNQSS